MVRSKKVSYFPSLNKIGNDMDLEGVLSNIKNGSIQKDLIFQIRDHQKTEKDYKGLKKQLGAFTPSGTFNDSHKATDLRVYSKIVVLDIDKLGERKIKQVKKKAIECLYSLAVFISPSGTGLKILVKVDTDKEMHDVAFQQVKSYYESLLSIKVDESGKDVSRLCFISYDPELYHNVDSNVFNSGCLLCGFSICNNGNKRKI